MISARNILTMIDRPKRAHDPKQRARGRNHEISQTEHQLINIGTALSSQTSLDKLLSLILAESRDLVSADAGSIYIREKNAPGGPLSTPSAFKISQNDSVDVSQAAEIVMPMDKKTIAGYVGCTGELLTIDDVYNLPASVPYTFGKDWDRKFGYRMKSMLTVPLKNLAGEVVGICFSCDRKPSRWRPFRFLMIMSAWGEPRIIRPYQKNCLRALDQAVELGKRRFLCELPTGTGKTDIVCLHVKRMFEAGRAERVLFLVDREQLAEQAIAALQDLCPKHPSYWLKPGMAMQHKQITVCLLQTMIGPLCRVDQRLF